MRLDLSYGGEGGVPTPLLRLRASTDEEDRSEQDLRSRS
jgi:hypothetical protein